MGNISVTESSLSWGAPAWRTPVIVCLRCRSSVPRERPHLYIFSYKSPKDLVSVSASSTAPFWRQAHRNPSASVSQPPSQLIFLYAAVWNPLNTLYLHSAYAILILFILNTYFIYVTIGVSLKSGLIPTTQPVISSSTQSIHLFLGRSLPRAPVQHSSLRYPHSLICWAWLLGDTTSSTHSTASILELSLVFVVHHSYKRIGSTITILFLSYFSIRPATFIIMLMPTGIQHFAFPMWYRAPNKTICDFFFLWNHVMQIDEFPLEE